MRPSPTSLILGPVAIAIGGMFLLMVFRPTLFLWDEAMPLALAAIVTLFGLGTIAMGIYSISYWLRMRTVARTVLPVRCRLRIRVEESSDSTSYTAIVRHSGNTSLIAVRGGRGLRHALSNGAENEEVEGLAWVEPGTDLPILLAVASPSGPLRLDSYGASRIPSLP